MSLWMWAAWGALLFSQNFSFTYVSRARNSGSLKSHLIAAVLSNGIWFATQLFTLGELLKLITGQHGFKAAALTVLFYTACTVSGSLISHQWCLKHEDGKKAVGANSKYAQITKEEWAKVIEYMVPISWPLSYIRPIEETRRRPQGMEQ